MGKGRTTAVLSVRVPDPMAARLKSEARSRKMLLNDHMKSILMAHLRWPNTGESGETWLPLGKGVGQVEEGSLEQGQEPSQEAVKGTARISGNAPCPCGATHPDGKRKKYKHCCGRR